MLHNKDSEINDHNYNTPFKHIPPEMREAKRWLVWKFVIRNGKTTKIPFAANNLRRPANSSDPNTWSSFNDAVAVVKSGKADGIGFAIEGSGYVFADFDNCIDSKGKLKKWDKGIVDRFAGKTFTEYSPSHNGIHIFMKAKKPGSRCKRTDLPGMEPGDGEAIEFYDSGRYATVTGDIYPGSPSTIADLNDEFASCYFEIFPEQDKSKKTRQPTSTGFNGDDSDLIAKAMAAKNGGKFTRLWNGDTSEYADDDSAADMALCYILAFYCGPDAARIDQLFRQSCLMREKWDSPRSDSTYGADTILKAIDGCHEFYDPKTSQPHRPNDQSEAKPRITATWRRQGKTLSGALTVHYNDETYTDHLNLAKSKIRLAALNGVNERWPDIDDSDLKTLRQRLEELAFKPETNPKDSTVNELEGATIIRPERIIHPNVSGIAVPVPYLEDGKPLGQWLLLLESEGKGRSALPMPDSIPDGNGGQLLVHPIPSPPSVSQADSASSWSKASREKWLRGEPPPDPVNLFNHLRKQYERYINLPDEHAEGTYALLALWTILTYNYHAWHAIPYLYIAGEKGTGKSRVLEVLEQLVFRPMVASNLTAPVLFRTLHSQGGALLLDEAERLTQAPDPSIAEINTILNAGYKKGGQAWRCVGDLHETMPFDVYGPKAFACINGLSDTLLHRCVIIKMIREPHGFSKGRRRINGYPKRWQQLRDDLHSLALAHGKVWLDLPTKNDVCPPNLSGREFELWQPIMALAAWLEEQGVEDLLELMHKQAAFCIACGRDAKMVNTDEILLRLLVISLREGNSRISATELLKKAKTTNPKEFSSWNANNITLQLRKYMIKTKRTASLRYYDTNLNQLREIQDKFNFKIFPDEE